MGVLVYYWLFLEVISQWKIFKVTLGAGNEVVWVCYYCVVIVLCLLVERPINRKQMMMMAITSMSIIMMLALVPYQFERKVIYLDIGQGDSSLIVDRGYNNVVLIDTGGQLMLSKEPWQIRKGASHAEKTVIPALQALGISRIKTLIITHADTDHMGNLKELSQVFPIDRVVMSQGMEKNPKMKQMMEKCPQLTWQLTKAPTTYQQGGIMMHILSPTNESTGDNHDSLVADVQFCEVDWLFLGDIDQEKELELLNVYPQMHTTILKLAHHGSNTSSHLQFLKKVHSRYAIISCGKHNHYHHPSKEVLKRLEEVHLPYARTDNEGAIEIIPKKKGIIVKKVLTNEQFIIVP
ncbi:competence protein ComEC [Granulicatella balaenopterae]|uniref:Competence protein ComEC n=1 Tax=Granulicatella balaenopterae TaxID=137733 RepID=A0A1H9KMP6_9LACT|nr:ComEC/Rec2 family competence protein [Granulicatella balaenopterae]SER00123.1 competence protein ComEC [Granulicatella balaenopterae]